MVRMAVPDRQKPRRTPQPGHKMGSQEAHVGGNRNKAQMSGLICPYSHVPAEATLFLERGRVALPPCPMPSSDELLVFLVLPLVRVLLLPLVRVLLLPLVWLLPPSAVSPLLLLLFSSSLGLRREGLYKALR
ncbi:hypothetical protein NDU88_007323 [Pleurodeles waltl]|uniref:Uncharacterized protein n=1 Tax=Pleurodeles waltl TaxID=8319 RepID=A0AAV7NVM2_PLEWA|nr:hypothetical protein NDU88_007323 [Pleurodeles waltl]